MTPEREFLRALACLLVINCDGDFRAAADKFTALTEEGFPEEHISDLDGFLRFWAVECIARGWDTADKSRSGRPPTISDEEVRQHAKYCTWLHWSNGKSRPYHSLADVSLALCPCFPPAATPTTTPQPPANPLPAGAVTGLGAQPQTQGPQREIPS